MSTPRKPPRSRPGAKWKTATPVTASARIPSSPDQRCWAAGGRSGTSTMTPDGRRGVREAAPGVPSDTPLRIRDERLLQRVEVRTLRREQDIEPADRVDDSEHRDKPAVVGDVLT